MTQPAITIRLHQGMPLVDADRSDGMHFCSKPVVACSHAMTGRRPAGGSVDANTVATADAGVLSCAVMLARNAWGVDVALDSDDARLGRLQPDPASKTSSTAEPIERSAAMFICPFS